MMRESVIEDTVIAYDTSLGRMQRGLAEKLIATEEVDLLVVKAGTNVSDSEYNRYRIAYELTQLRKSGLYVALISSGAIHIGRRLRADNRELDSIPEDERDSPYQKRLNAMRGQPEHFRWWQSKFGQIPNEQAVQEVRAVNAEFTNYERTELLKADYETWFRAGVIPVINEDDARSFEEIDILLHGERVFRDNDGLLSLMACFFKQQMGLKPIAVNLTVTDGIYTAESYGSSQPNTIRIVIRSDGLDSSASEEKSEGGSGGLLSKIICGRELSEAGIPLVIADGRFETIESTHQSKESYNPFQSVLDRELVGTAFIPSANVASDGSWGGLLEQV